MRQRRCLVSAAISAPNYGRMLVPGHLVDLDERTPTGVRLGDLVREEWFEPVPTDAEPKSRRKPPTTEDDVSDAPARPAAKETHHG